MRIYYSAGNYCGSGLRLKRFLPYVESEHEVKISAFVNSIGYIDDIDLISDTLYFNVKNSAQLTKSKELLGVKDQRVPRVNYDALVSFYSEIVDFSPDLVISDFEPISAAIAKRVGAKLWYCSPILLNKAIDYTLKQRRYTENVLYSHKNFKRFYPEADRYLVYSPFGNVEGIPEINSGFEWVKPYHLMSEKKSEKKSGEKLALVSDDKRKEVLNKIFFCSDDFRTLSLKESYFNYLKEYSNYDTICTMGSTGEISDAIYNENKIIIAPDVLDYEATANARVLRSFGFGSDIGNFDLMKSFHLQTLQEALEEDKSYKLNNKSIKQLHEVIWEM